MQPEVRPAIGFRTGIVQRTELLTPHMLRVTLGGPELEGLTTYGGDQHIKLYFARPGATMPEPFTRETFLALPRAERPTLRTYTIRKHRPEACEIDIDFVLHGATGPGSAWAERAKPGDTLTFVGPRGGYRPDPAVPEHWLFADETALPAAAAMIEDLPRGVRARAFIEVAGSRERQPLPSAARVETTWLYRDGVPCGKSDLLMFAAQSEPFSKGKVAVWIACEAAKLLELRRYFREQRGVDRDLLKATGYWHLGKSEDDVYEDARRGELVGA